jgi:hypothetical protein
VPVVEASCQARSTLNTFSGETEDRTSQGTCQELSVGFGGYVAPGLHDSSQRRIGYNSEHPCQLCFFPTAGVACHPGQEAYPGRIKQSPCVGPGFSTSRF